MNDFTGVYVASGSLVTLAAGVVIELQLPAGSTHLTLLKAWISPSENAPIDLVQGIDLYTNDAVATASTALTEVKIRGTKDATPDVVAVRTGTIGATPTTIFSDAFHYQNGWLYAPIPEEMITLIAGTTEDNIGINIPTLRGAPVCSFGAIWGERG